MSTIPQDVQLLDGEVIPPAPAATRLPSESEIEALGAAVRAGHEAGERCGREAVKHFQRCGDALIEVKAMVGHCRFAPFLKAAGVHPRQAQRYMLLARELPKLPAAKATRVSQLSLRDAVGELARLSSRAARLPAPALDQALIGARREPLKKAVTKAANTARGSTTAPTIVTTSVVRAAVPNLQPGNVQLLVGMLMHTIGIQAETLPNLTSQDALEALEVLCKAIRENGLALATGKGV